MFSSIFSRKKQLPFKLFRLLYFQVISRLQEELSSTKANLDQTLLLEVNDELVSPNFVLSFPSFWQIPEYRCQNLAFLANSRNKVFTDIPETVSIRGATPRN